jgi:hypothetical protein
VADDQKMVLAYSRRTANVEIIIVFNRSDKVQSVNLTDIKYADYRNILSSGGVEFKNTSSGIEINLEPLSAVVLRNK